MFGSWIFFLLFVSGGAAFMIQNSRLGLCLEDCDGDVLLQNCNLDSGQQWAWLGQDMLMCVSSSRCLWSEQIGGVQTRSCDPVHAAGLGWDCDGSRLISRNNSMFLTGSRKHLVLSWDGKMETWKKLEGGEICQEKPRSRRASKDSDLSEYEDESAGEQGMTEEQREYLRWYYRTEDPTTWKFVLLGLAFVCLLVGFLLLGIGAVANKSRKKIAQYKAAASLLRKPDGEELQVITSSRDNGASPQQLRKASSSSSSELKAGDIVVTWRDGNTSNLFPQETTDGCKDV